MSLHSRLHSFISFALLFHVHSARRTRTFALRSVDHAEQEFVYISMLALAIYDAFPTGSPSLTTLLPRSTTPRINIAILHSLLGRTLLCTG
jgi:hypothetical protein